MKGKIFTAYHYIPEPGDIEYRADDLYQPVVMGLEVGDRPDLLSDLHGDAPYYSPLSIEAGYDEICAKWYVWKNLLSKYDWFGFQQYRRQLNFEGRSNDEIRALVDQYDIITCGPDFTTRENKNIRETAKGHFGARAWDPFEKLMGSEWDFTVPLNHPHNVWIMHADEFDRYMTKWSEVFLELAKIMRPGPPRIYGYLTERFFTIYLDRLTRDRPNTKVLVLPGIQEHGWLDSSRIAEERERKKGQRK